MTEEIKQSLFAEKDEKYRLFNIRLIPNVSDDTVIGVRMPAIRRIAKELVKKDAAAEFLSDLPHVYHEENLLHALLIGYVRDEDECFALLESFLPYVNNWAVCDSLRPSFFKRHTQKCEDWLLDKLDDAHPYTVRFAIEMLMLHYLGDTFKAEYMEQISRVTRENYYVNMMVSWYFATALAERYGQALEYLEAGRLPVWIHNKTISKACDSFRLTDEEKTYLKTLRKH